MCVCVKKEREIISLCDQYILYLCYSKQINNKNLLLIPWKLSLYHIYFYICCPVLTVQSSKMITQPCAWWICFPYATPFPQMKYCYPFTILLLFPWQKGAILLSSLVQTYIARTCHAVYTASTLLHSLHIRLTRRNSH